MNKKFSKEDQRVALQSILAIAQKTGKQKDIDLLYTIIYEVYFSTAFAISTYYHSRFAEDVVQEIFIKILKKDLENFPDFHDGSFDAYFITSCINYCRTFHRLYGKKNSMEELNLLKPDSRINGPDQIVESGLDLDFYLSLLSDIQKDIFILHISGFRYSEVAESLGINLNTVRNTLNRVRAKLKQVRHKEGEKIHDLGHRKTA